MHHNFVMHGKRPHTISQDIFWPKWAFQT